MATMTVPPLLEILADIPDVRHNQGKRHPLAGMLGLACVATLCGYTTVKAITEWGRHYGERYAAELGFSQHGYPAQVTWYRVFSTLDMRQVEVVLGRWCERVVQVENPSGAVELEGISVDGKTLRGSRKQGAHGSHLLAAATHRLGSVLAQVAVGEHSNEITHMETLLFQLALQGRVVTTDALLTQTDIAETIIQQGGEYVLPVKENQPLTYAAVQDWFEGQPPPEMANGRADVIEKGHGRLTHWHIETSTALNAYLVDWCGLQQCFALTCRTIQVKTGQVHCERHYGLTSLSPQRASPHALLTFKRHHWSIENRLHWVRDVVFREDSSQVHRGHTHQVMAALRNLVIGLLRALGHSSIAEAVRYYAANPHQALNLVTSPIIFGE